jgi:hypothetical protein
MNATCRTIYTLFILFLITSVPPLSAQNDFREECEGQEEAAISDFTMTPDGSVYAFGSATCRSTDSGHTWKKTSDLGVILVISDRDETLYATSGWLLYRSTESKDNGRSRGIMPYFSSSGSQGSRCHGWSGASRHARQP